MTQIGKLTVHDARLLAKALRARGVLIIAFDDDNYAAASFGKKKRDCEDMAALSDSITDAIEHEIFTTWSKRNAGGRVVSPSRKLPCVIGAHCAEHGFIHGAEAEELRSKIEKALPDIRRDDRAVLQRVLDDVDARDSLAWLETKGK
jgi:hypothetical protein